MSGTSRFRVNVVWNGPFIGRAKLVQSVDISQSGHRSLLGPNLRPDTLVELPLGSLILTISPVESPCGYRFQAHVRAVTCNVEDMNLATTIVAFGDWDDKRSAIIDACEEHLASQRGHHMDPLGSISNSLLIAEVHKRGLTVAPSDPQVVLEWPMSRKEIAWRLMEISNDIVKAIAAIDQINAGGIKTMWMGEPYDIEQSIASAREEIVEGLETVQGIALLQREYETYPESFRDGTFV